MGETATSLTHIESGAVPGQADNDDADEGKVDPHVRVPQVDGQQGDKGKQHIVDSKEELCPLWACRKETSTVRE